MKYPQLSKKLHFILFTFLCLPFWALGQTPASYDAADIATILNKLPVSGTVLYVAAHPDDENTRLIAYLAQEKGLQVYYLSLTRGDGGQNLIGNELGDGLGVIRTQELLASRRIDGGNQLFTRARDFGFSKNPEETFNIWDRRIVLRDVVKIIRDIQPDVILTRFSPDPAPTHGHHTASAILAREAFRVAATDSFDVDMQAFNQTPWQAKRVYWNISSFFFQGRENEFNANNYLKIDIGTYNPVRGKGYQEIASDSRSQHKSQGFGTATSRGSSIEYFQFLGGDSAKTDVLEGINWSVKRLPRGEALELLLQKAKAEYNPNNPSAITNILIDAYQVLLGEMKNMSASQKHLFEVKKRQIEQALVAVNGIRVELVNSTQVVEIGEKLNLTAEIVKRSKVPVQISNMYGMSFDTTFTNVLLPDFEPLKLKLKQVRMMNDISSPYWLYKRGKVGVFEFGDIPEYRQNEPENIPSQLKVTIKIGSPEKNCKFVLPMPITYKMVDPVKGELYHPLEVVPSLSLKFQESIILLSGNKPVTTQVWLEANGKEVMPGKLSLFGARGVKITPSEIAYPKMKVGEKKYFSFTIQASSATLPEYIEVSAIDSFNTTYTRGIQRIRYDHIPNQILLPEVSLKAVPINLEIAGKEVGYIMGAGDDVPEAIRRMGYKVTELKETDIQFASLKKFDAVVIGIRAYNTHPWLFAKKPELKKFMENGGNVIVQYNTANFLSGGLSAMDSVGIYPMKVGRDRVTVENAPVTILAPKHPALNYPNVITEADFKYWVQERGLYYPSEWNSKYTALISMADPNEPKQDGAILVAKVGKGNYIYTGISFFRQLPAGVPGAFRLFANLLSLGKQKTK